MQSDTDVTVVGAGPYGLSIAAHLRDAGIRFRIFGTPMQTWRQHMPDGMLLKSDGFASNLSDPKSFFSLKHYCQNLGVPYDDTKLPVRLETFREYGLEFQRRLVPELEDTQVEHISRRSDLYSLRLTDGEEVTASHVVLAVGISHFAYVPSEVGNLASELLSHSSAHKTVEGFRGRQVTVVGSGASAIDLSVLLHEAGAQVTLISRRPALKFHGPPTGNGNSRWHSLRSPSSPIGPGWTSRLCSDAPWAFHRLPEAVRLRIVTRHLGPSAGWPMKDRFIGKVATLLGCHIEQAVESSGRVRLALTTRDGRKEHTTDHVIVATGYRVDLGRLMFLAPEIGAQIRSSHHAPILSPGFESSVPGLYFVGAASMNSFGPMMRFACGSDWTARRISKSLMNSAFRRPVPAATTAVAS